MLDDVLEVYPKTVTLKAGFTYMLRPLESTDENAFYEFFQAIPENEKLFIKHRVSEPGVIRTWCQNIDLGHVLPLLAVHDCKIIADCSLHQQLGGWKRHIGRVSILVHPQHRGRGLGRALVREVTDIARRVGLEKVEAEFLGEQETALKLFGLLGFRPLLRLPDYVKDMQATPHDYVMMGLDLKTDEEYAGVG